MKPKDSPEAREALEAIKAAERFNNVLIAKGASGVQQLADRLAKNQRSDKTFEEFYRDLAENPLLERQVRTILLSMAETARQAKEDTLARMETSRVRQEVRNALRKPRPSPVIEEEVFAEGLLPGEAPYTQDLGGGGSRRLPIEVVE